MITADIIAIGAFIIFTLLGSVVGFGNGLKFITRGTFGKILSVIICYFLFGIVISLPFVNDLLIKFANHLSEQNNGFLNFLLTIRIDLIVFAIVLFILVQLAKQLIVAIISSIMNAKNPVIKVINKVTGVILFLALFIILVLIIFQIVAWISGVDGGLFGYLNGSIFGLDYVYVNNPLNALFENIRLIG